MTIKVTLQSVKEEIKNDPELSNVPKVMVSSAIIQFIGVIEGDDRYTITPRSKQAILKYAEDMTYVGK